MLQSSIHVASGTRGLDWSRGCQKCTSDKDSDGAHCTVSKFLTLIYPVYQTLHKVMLYSSAAAVAQVAPCPLP